MRVHKTGGGPAPKPLTSIEKAIEHILGKTPEFIGVVQEVGNSKIQMKRGIRHNDLQAKICNAQMVGETPNLVNVTNTGQFMSANWSRIFSIDAHNFVHSYIHAVSLQIQYLM